MHEDVDHALNKCSTDAHALDACASRLPCTVCGEKCIMQTAEYYAGIIMQERYAELMQSMQERYAEKL